MEEHTGVYKNPSWRKSVEEKWEEIGDQGREDVLELKASGLFTDIELGEAVMGLKLSCFLDMYHGGCVEEHQRWEWRPAGASKLVGYDKKQIQTECKTGKIDASRDILGWLLSPGNIIELKKRRNAYEQRRANR